MHPIESNQTMLETFAKLGFSKNEAKIYLASLRLKQATAAELSKESGVHRANVYDALKSLAQKGLATVLEVGGRPLYQAADPILLRSFVKEQETTLQSILPQLQLYLQLNKDGLNKDETKVEFFDGLGPLRKLLLHFLELDEERVVYGVPKQASQVLGEFLNGYHQERIKQNKRLRQIYNSDAKERIAYLNSLPNTEARYLAPEYDSPVATSVCGNTVVLTLWGASPVSIVIRNHQIAGAYKRYFEFLWEQANQ